MAKRSSWRAMIFKFDDLEEMDIESKSFFWYIFLFIFSFAYSYVVAPPQPPGDPLSIVLSSRIQTCCLSVLLS